ncbi:MAG: hybrid sensor histidine kinase/response regulator [Elusimicrobia bacterium]|nr:hybrid sensor histidine kinase/response regulator [Elusimicrobiota bacterium]
MTIRTQIALTLSGVAALCFLIAWGVGLLFARGLVLQVITSEHKRQIAELRDMTETALGPGASASSTLAEYLKSIPEVTPSVDYAYLESADSRILLHTDPRYEGKGAASWAAVKSRSLDYAAPVMLGTSTIATAHLGARADLGRALYADLGRFLLPAVLFFTTGGLVFSLALGFGLALLLAQPVYRILAAVQEVGSGNLSVEVPVTSSNELGELAGQFNAMVGQLRELDRMKAEFITSVSHDLRSPMAAINMCVEFMLHEDPERDKILPRHRQLLGTLTEHATRLSVFVSNILDAAKIDAGRMEFQIQPVAVAPMAKGLVELYDAAAKNKGVSLELALPADLPPALADPAHLERVLTNLLSNAVKFTPSGGRIKFGGGGARGRCELYVADTGVGIPEDRQSSLFSRFEQIGGPAKEGSGFAGTGLGLYIVKQSVEAMGGTVAIDSAPGKGTRVSISLPAAAAPPAPSPAAREAPKSVPAVNSARILVVDDDASFATMTQGLLQARGYQASVAPGYRSVRDSAIQEKPDLILLDMRLGAIKSTDVIRELKSDASTAGIPVIACSAVLDLPEVQRSLEAGAACFLPKPLKAGELDQRIREVLSQRRRA